MRKFLTYFVGMLLCTFSWAQDADILARIQAANLKSTLEATFTQVRHSPMLTEDLRSEGYVALQAPDKVHWEVRKPVSQVSVFNGDIPQGGRRFRLPTEKDFTVSSLEGGQEQSVILKPVRRDLKQLFSQIVLKVDPATLAVRSVLLSGLDGDWTQITFSNVKTDIPLSPELFQK